MASTSSTGIEPAGNSATWRRVPASCSFDGLAPRLALAGVDLAQVQHLALHHAAVAAAPVLHHAPVVVGLAVLLASVAAQEHGPKFWVRAAPGARTKVSTTDPVATRSLQINNLRCRGTLNSQVIHGNLRKTG